MKDKTVKKCFYLVLIISLLLLFLSIPLTHYDSLRLYLWKKGGSFYDFFSCLRQNIYWNRNQLYVDGTIYPPLANLIYALITRCMSVETLKEMARSGMTEMKAFQECSIYFVLYLVVTTVAYYIICTSWKQGSKLEKNVFAVSLLISVPFLYQMERANIIFVALIFSMMFFLWKDSENRILRELSYLSLAIAAGIKLYPAVFGLLVLKEKRYKDTIRLLLYGLLLFILPFSFYGGIDSFRMLLKHITETSDSVAMTRIGCQIDYVTILRSLLRFTGGNCLFWAKTLRGGLFFIGIGAALKLQHTWKATLLSVCLMIGVPSISYVYTAIFMIIPIVLYLDSGNKEKRDLIYLAGMLLVIIPIPFCWKEGAGDPYYSYMHISTPVRIEGMSILLMTLFLIRDAIFSFRSVAKRMSAVMTSLVLLFIAAGMSQLDCESAYPFTNYLPQTLSDKVKVEEGTNISQSFTAHGEALDSIVIKMQPAEIGHLHISVIRESDGEIIFEGKQNMDQLEKGYNRIVVDRCPLVPGEQYIAEFILEDNAEYEAKFWRTVTSIDTGKEVFLLNGKKLRGALAIQFCEVQ